MITKTISHYEILAPIGEGGMGVVYRALDTRLGRPVAVKLLRPDGAIDGERRKRFVQEARAASALNHPHIITIYDIGQAEGVDFIAMEYVAGPSLAHVIGAEPADCRGRAEVRGADRRRAGRRARRWHSPSRPQAGQHHAQHGRRQGVDQGARFRAREADRVRRLHADRRARHHGDRARAEERLQTEEGTILGTAAYMSPEQAEGKPADARSDVFSFGAVLYEMLTGRRAFSGATKMSTLAAILTREPEPPSHADPRALARSRETAFSAASGRVPSDAGSRWRI